MLKTKEFKGLPVPMSAACAPRPRIQAGAMDLIAHNRCGSAALMNSSVCIVRVITITRFGGAVEDVVR